MDTFRPDFSHAVLFTLIKLSKGMQWMTIAGHIAYLRSKISSLLRHFFNHITSNILG